jgi:predicted transposase YbfD/YdcC
MSKKREEERKKENEHMKRKETLQIQRLISLSKHLKDPRRVWGNKRHELTDILIMTLLAVISGCEEWDDIRDYAQTKIEWLRTFLPLKNGIPSKSTFRRVFARINPEELEGIYRKWAYPYVGTCCGKQLCIDGKTLRGVQKRGDAALHMVSMWVREDQITLGQIKTAEKSNEITAIPQLIQSLDIQGGVVAIDAIGCQKEIAKCIREKEAHYILAVKENHPTLYQEIKAYFDWAIEDPIEQNQISQYKHIDFDHGKTSKWRVFSTKDTVWFESKGDWAGLVSFVMVECSRTVRGANCTQRRYYISSLETDAERFHQAIRGHWHVENKLHWMLDVAFHEDNCLIHQGNAPQNLSLLRKMALTMLRLDSSRNTSILRHLNIWI